MRNLNIDTARNYSTEANLDKGTAKVDAMLAHAEQSNEITGDSEVRKMVVRNREGRYTATYLLRGNARHYASCIASAGFMAIG